jgi:hypothetical protein
MENIYILLLIGLVCWGFIYLRKIEEVALKIITLYCQKENLQFIAQARRTSSLKFSKTKGVYLSTIFDFEFSGDGESSYDGVVYLRGLKLENIVMPPYRVS